MDLGDSGLLWHKSLTQFCFCKCPWSGSILSPMELTISGLLRPRLLAQSCSCGICYLRPALAQVAGSVLLLWSSLPQAQSSLGCWLSLNPYFLSILCHVRYLLSTQHIYILLPLPLAPNSDSTLPLPNILFALKILSSYWPINFY